MSRHQDEQEQKQRDDEESEYRHFLDNDQDYQKWLDTIEAQRTQQPEKADGRPF